MSLPSITLIGNLVDDPELRYTPSGRPVVNFRIAVTPRVWDRETREWRNGDPLFLPCSWWGQPAENVAESLEKGARVIVSGQLRQRTFETREGEKRTVMEVLVEEAGASLRYTTVTVNRVQRSGASNSGQQQPSQQDQWASDTPPF